MAKAELKTQATRQSADAFLSRIPDTQTREDCLAIAQMMKQVTKAEPVMWGPSIVGFGNWTYRYESGREGDWFFMGFSPRKQNLTLYIMPGFDHFEDEMAKLGKYKTGKSCLYVKRLDDIDRGVLKQIMTKAAKQVKQIAKAPTVQAGVRELKAKKKKAGTGMKKKHTTRKSPAKKA